MTKAANRWTAAVRSSSQPAYIAIADAISEDIQAGRLSADQRLPPLRELAALLGLNFTTAARGYAEAQRRGLIDSKAGRGTFIRAISPTAMPSRTPAAIGLIDMTMNMPPEPQDPALLKRLRQGVAGLADVGDLYSALRYQEFGGSAEDRDAGARWLGSRLRDVTGNRVLVCPGVQSALLGLFSMLARPGELLCCESITYPGVKGLAAQLGIRLVGLPGDDDGIDPEAFAALCAADRPRALYCNPTFRNPTTATYSLARREALAEIARRYGVPIIEDDAYGMLPTETPPPLATLAPELTFYVTGFAKCVGAGLRIAYLAAPNSRYGARIAATLRTTAVMTSPLSTQLATQWINDGTAEAATAAVREESMTRQAIARRVLRRAEFQTKPEAFHLWLSVPPPWNRIEFATHLRAHGVGVVVADAFTVAGPAPEAVRVCLGGAATREECQHSLEVIEDAIEQLPALAFSVM